MRKFTGVICISVCVLSALPVGAQSPAMPAFEVASIKVTTQEQLGLKLESTRGPVDMLVIDHVERPTEN